MEKHWETTRASGSHEGEKGTDLKIFGKWTHRIKWSFEWPLGASMRKMKASRITFRFLAWVTRLFF